MGSTKHKDLNFICWLLVPNFNETFLFRVPRRMKCDPISFGIKNESHRKESAAHREQSDDQDLHWRGKESFVIVIIGSR
jgi:hypothetical protein